MKVSVFLPFSPAGLKAPRLMAQLVESGRADRFWMGHSFGVDTLQAFAAVAGSGLRVPCGLAVGLVPLQSAYQTALQARSAAALTGHSLVCGIGIGSPEFSRILQGEVSARPSTDTVEHIREVRNLLDGGRLRLETGEPSPVGLLPMDAPEVEVGAGILRPRHARRAAEVADVGITMLAPRDYLGETLIPAWQEGARTRPLGRPSRVVSIVQVIPVDAGPPPDVPGALVAATQGHLALPHYRSMLSHAGFDGPFDDPVQDARRLVSAGAVLVGPVADIAADLVGLSRIGVDEVVLSASGVFATGGMSSMLHALECVAVATRRLAAQER